jgi:hypothetical protein
MSYDLPTKFLSAITTTLRTIEGNEYKTDEEILDDLEPVLSAQGCSQKPSRSLSEVISRIHNELQ